MENIKKYLEPLKPYTDILLFVVALLAANYFWKFTVLGDEGGDQVTWLGMDISRPFDWMAQHIAHVVYWLIHLTNDAVVFFEPSTIHFATGTGTKIVWGCTGLKQSFIWIVIMLVARGSWKHKLWFIPLGLACAYLFNILRITLIAMAIEHHPEWFHLLHDYVFKYMFYGMLFCLWLWWSNQIADAAMRRYPISVTR
jgi:exosortase/archaeosortase family protein